MVSSQFFSNPLTDGFKHRALLDKGNQGVTRLEADGLIGTATPLVVECAG